MERDAQVTCLDCPLSSATTLASSTLLDLITFANIVNRTNGRNRKWAYSLQVTGPKMWDVLNRDRLNDNEDRPPKATGLAYFIYVVGVVIKLLTVLDKMSFKVSILSP